MDTTDNVWTGSTSTNYGHYKHLCNKLRQASMALELYTYSDNFPQYVTVVVWLNEKYQTIWKIRATIPTVSRAYKRNIAISTPEPGYIIKFITNFLGPNNVLLSCNLENRINNHDSRLL